MDALFSRRSTDGRACLFPPGRFKVFRTGQVITAARRAIAIKSAERGQSIDAVASIKQGALSVALDEV